MQEGRIHCPPLSSLLLLPRQQPVLSLFFFPHHDKVELVPGVEPGVGVHGRGVRVVHRDEPRARVAVPRQEPWICKGGGGWEGESVRWAGAGRRLQNVRIVCLYGNGHGPWSRASHSSSPSPVMGPFTSRTATFFPPCQNNRPCHRRMRPIDPPRRQLPPSLHGATKPALSFSSTTTDSPPRRPPPPARPRSAAPSAPRGTGSSRCKKHSIKKKHWVGTGCD